MNLPYLVFSSMKNKTTLNTETITNLLLYHLKTSTMDPTSSRKRIKTRARKNKIPHVVYSDSDSSDAETFVNSYA